MLIFYLVGTPYIRGFNCDDESIRYPYKDNTISTALLCVYSLGLPVITVRIKLILPRDLRPIKCPSLLRPSVWPLVVISMSMSIK